MSPNAAAAVHTGGFFHPGVVVVVVVLGGGSRVVGGVTWCGARVQRCGQERPSSRGARHGGSDTVATGFPIPKYEPAGH